MTVKTRDQITEQLKDILEKKKAFITYDEDRGVHAFRMNKPVNGNLPAQYIFWQQKEELPNQVAMEKLIDNLADRYTILTTNLYSIDPPIHKDALSFLEELKEYGAVLKGAKRNLEGAFNNSLLTEQDEFGLAIQDSVRFGGLNPNENRWVRKFVHTVLEGIVASDPSTFATWDKAMNEIEQFGLKESECLKALESIKHHFIEIADFNSEKGTFNDYSHIEYDALTLFLMGESEMPAPEVKKWHEKDVFKGIKPLIEKWDINPEISSNAQKEHTQAQSLG